MLVVFDGMASYKMQIYPIGLEIFLAVNLAASRQIDILAESQSLGHFDQPVRSAQASGLRSTNRTLFKGNFHAQVGVHTNDGVDCQIGYIGIVGFEYTHDRLHDIREIRGFAVIVTQLIVELGLPFFGDQWRYFIDHFILTAILHRHDKETGIVTGQNSVSVDPALLDVINIVAEDKQAAR